MASTSSASSSSIKARIGNLSDYDIVAGGHYLALGFDDGTFEVWNTGRGERISSHRDDAIGRGAVAVSPDGHTAAYTRADGTIALIDVDTDEQVAVLVMSDDTEPFAYADLTFAPDGHTLAANAGDGTVRTWHLPLPTDLTAEACASAGHPLTTEEWSRYVGDEPHRNPCQS